MALIVDEVTEMYRVADDYEAGVLDQLLERAGITWECYGPEPDGFDSFASCWTNRRDDAVCDQCGNPRPPLDS